MSTPQLERLHAYCSSVPAVSSGHGAPDLAGTRGQAGPGVE